MSLEEFDLLEIPALGCLQVAHVRHRRSNQGADTFGVPINSVIITALAAIAGSLVGATQHNVSDLQKLLPVYALLSRIRLSSSEQVLQKAEQVVRTIVNTYPQSNLTADQIESRAVNGQDPLTAFSDTCRSE